MGKDSEELGGSARLEVLHIVRYTAHSRRHSCCLTARAPASYSSLA